MDIEHGSGGRELLRSVWGSDAGAISSDGAEMLLDLVLDEGLLRDIPVFGWIAKIHGVTNSVRDKIFLQKIFRFLVGTQETTVEEQQAFSERIQADPDHQRKVGEGVLLLIDRHEDAEKSEILGRVFAAFVRNDISYEEFQRYAFIIDKLYLQDLIDLHQYYSRINEFEASRERGETLSLENFLDEMKTQTLFGNGLLDSEGYVETTFRRNSFGDKLIRVIGTKK